MAGRRSGARSVAVALLVLGLTQAACSGVEPDDGSPGLPRAPAATVAASPSAAEDTPVLPAGFDPALEPRPRSIPPRVPPCPPVGQAASSAGLAPRISGWLHTCGTRIVDERGLAVRLLSVAYSGMEDGAGLPGAEGLAATGCEGWVAPTEDDYSNMEAAGWNSVRVAVSWANLEPAAPSGGSHRYDARYLAALDRIVNELTGRGLAVILDMHQVRWSPAFRALPVFGRSRTFCQGTGLPAWLYPGGGGLDALVASELAFFTGQRAEAEEGLISAWTFLVDRYSGKRRVIGADLLNESYDLLAAPYPGAAGLRPPDLDLAGFHERVGAAIHAVNPRLLLFVEDNISRRTGLFALTRRPDLSNMVYAPHLYQESWDDVAEQRLSRYHGRSKRWDVPIWLGELTRFGVDPNWRASLTRAVQFCRERGIDWAVWSYRADWFEPGGAQPGIVDVLRSGF